MTRMIFNAAIKKKRFNPAQEVKLPKVIEKRIQPQVKNTS